MNYFAHGYRFLDNPYFLAGTAVPDWLTVCDRSVRLRSKHVAEWVQTPSPPLAALAQGILQHFRDDARFHETRAFAETSLALAALVRGVLSDDPGFRPTFLGHLLTELLLDDALIARFPGRLEEYYATLARVDFQEVEAGVNRLAPRPARRLALFARQFLHARILSDYADDAKLLVRLNQIMQRVQLPPLPSRLGTILAAARRLVAGRQADLLQDIAFSGEQQCVME